MLPLINMLLIWSSSWFTCWSFSWYSPLTGTLRCTAGDIAFPNISARYLNAHFFEFTIITSGLSGAGLCITRIKSYAASIVASVEEIFGMLEFLGKKLYHV